MSTSIFSVVAFGTPGLTTVHYALLNMDGTVAVARTNTGVLELAAPYSGAPAPGIYFATITGPASWRGMVVWDNGLGGTAVDTSSIGDISTLLTSGTLAVAHVTLDPTSTAPISLVPGTLGYALAALLLPVIANSTTANTLVGTIPGTAHTVSATVSTVGSTSTRIISIS